MDELISIIVPIYNVERYLEQCLRSIEMQTYRNFEVVCIDDGSSDGSLGIANKFTERDSRFHVISRENGGRSSARNVGIEQANGTYLMFVDGDDWIEIDTCQNVVDAIEKYDCDLVMWTYLKEYGNASDKKVIFDGDRVFDESQCKALHRRTIGMYEDEWHHPENADALASMCSKIIKRSIVEQHNIRFMDTSVIGPWEDGLFTLQYMEHTQKAVFLDKAFYHYRKAVGITSRHNPQLKALWKFRQKYLRDYIAEKKLDSTYSQALRNRNAWNLFSLASNSMCLPYRKAYVELKSILNDEEFHQDVKTLRMEYLPIHWKVLYFCAKLKCTPFVFLLFLYVNKKRKNK